MGTMKTDIPLGAFCVGLIVGGMFAVAVMQLVAVNGIKRNAISAGVAHYEVNPTTGKVSFVWITNHLNQVTK